VALVWSWPNWWAVEYRPGLSSALNYLDEATRYYAAVWQHQVGVDIISPDSPLDGYDLVIAPLLYLITEEQAAALERYVEAGGTLVSSYFSGIVGEDARAWLGGSPGPLRRTLGIWVEEVDPLLPGQQNSIVVPAGEALPFGAYGCDLWCEVVHLEGARALAQFGQDFYAGQPAITSHQLGAGRALYIATRPDAGLLGALFGELLGELGIAAPLDAPQGVEVTQRQIGNQSFIFLLNHHAEGREVGLPQAMRDLLTGHQHSGSIQLGPRGVAILANP
jgi:beta-galactosidase